MSDIQEFRGSVLCRSPSALGEGPTYDPSTDTAWWFNILGKELHALQLATGVKTVHPLPMMASVLARIDRERQLIASDDGLFIRDTGSGELTFYHALEPGKHGNRSNDGRTHPCGALWVGTMGRKAEDGAGAIYHVARNRVSMLFDTLSIPNSICFSPDGTVGYFTDSRVNTLMRVPVDPTTGLPRGKPEILVDGTTEPGDIDGSICDTEGCIWNARWGAGAVDRYAPDGRRIARYLVPAGQTSCPAFIGRNADRILVTSAWQGLDDAARAADPQAGFTFDLGITVKGIFDTAFRL